MQSVADAAVEYAWQLYPFFEIESGAVRMLSIPDDTNFSANRRITDAARENSLRGFCSLGQYVLNQPFVLVNELAQRITCLRKMRLIHR